MNTTESQPLPANLEAEQALLGAIFHNNAVLYRVSDFLEPGHFSEPVHRVIYEAATTLFRSGSVANAITLKDHLPVDQMIGDRTPAQYLAGLQAESSGDLAAEGFARRITDLASQREAAAIAQDLSSSARDQAVNGAFAPALEMAIERLQHLHEAGSGAPRVKLLSSPEFVAGFVAPDYLVYGVLQRRFVYSLTGQTGAGKTAISLLLCYRVGAHKPLGETRVAGGRALFCAGENPDDIRMRWISMGETLGFNPNGADGPAVHFIDGTGPFSKTEASIRRQVQALGGVDLVVIDTSAAFFEGDDENSNVQAAQHARRLRHLTTLPGGPAVLVNCHPVKSAQSDNLVPRGGGAFIAEMDGNLTGAKNGELVEVHWQGKFRGPDFAPMMFKLLPVKTRRLVDSTGKMIPSVVALSVAAAERAEAEHGVTRDEDALLIAMLEHHNGSLADLARAAGFFLRNGELDRTKVRRVAEALSRDKLTRHVRRTWRLTAPGKVEAAERAKVTSVRTSRGLDE